MIERKNSLVLIVDDIESNIEFMLEIINSIYDIDTESTTNGEEAIQIAKNHRPDLILLDIAMPKMDGFEVCRRLKADPSTADIPIIFLTARRQNEDIVLGFKVGAVDYISKPFNHSELLSRVHTQLKLRRKSKQLKKLNLELEDKVFERTEELSEANQSLNEAYRQLSTLDRAKNDFITHINHELRTPLNGIMGYTSLLSELILDKEASSYINSINILVSRFTKLAEISLLFTELQTVNNKINLEKVEIIKLIENATDIKELEEKELEIIIQHADNSACALGESRLITACISIIIDNAIKYSPKNGRIQISTSTQKETVTIDIQDNGPGFSDQAKEQLFGLFKADNLEQKSYGFGIGLATAKNIVDLINGKLSIRNRNGQGAIVSLHLQRYDSSKHN